MIDEIFGGLLLDELFSYLIDSGFTFGRASELFMVAIVL